MLELKPVKYRVIDVTGVEEANRQDAAAQDKPTAVIFWLIVACIAEAAIAIGVWVHIYGWRLM